jgi:hypothetical protein
MMAPAKALLPKVVKFTSDQRDLVGLGDRAADLPHQGHHLATHGDPDEGREEDAEVRKADAGHPREA